GFWRVGRRSVRAVVLVSAVLAPRLGAQMVPTRSDTLWRDTTKRFSASATAKKLNVDSLAARLERTEAALEVLREQMATEAASYDGDFELDFFAGGEAAATEAYLFPEPRLRVAKFALRWPKTELMLGGETPLISDLNPITVASVGVPGFSASGNLWNWLPQA